MASPITTTRSRRKARTISVGTMNPSQCRLTPTCRPVICLEGSPADDAQSVHRVAGHELGGAQIGGGWGLGAEIDQDGAAAGATAGLDIVQDIADKPGAL